MNLESIQLFCLAEGKGPHEWPGYCHQYFFYLEVVVVMILIHPCSDLSYVIFDTDQDEGKYNFIFLLGDGISG